MPTRSHRSVSSLVVALSATLSSSVAVGQDLPPPPSPDLLGRAFDAPAPDHDLQRAVQLVRTRQSEQAVMMLARMARDRGVDLRGYGPVAVLFRLADGRSRPGAPTGGVLPSAAPTPSVNGADALPPPPSDEVVRARTIDAVVERLARWDMAAAGAYLQSAGDPYTLPGPDGESLRMLRSLARNPAPAIDSEMASSQAFAPQPQLLPDRPAGTMEGFEVLTMYVSTASYGLMLGTWAGLAVTRDSRNAVRIALPLTGISAGIVGAIVLDRSRAARRGRGYAFNSGLVLGGLAGTAAAIYVQPGGAVDGWGLALGGATLGIGAALGLAHLVDALPGSVSHVTTTGLWGSAVGVAMAMAIEPTRSNPQNIASGMLVGEGVGVVLGLLTATLLQPTPAQSRWADLGACVGGMLGGSLGAGMESTQGIGVGMAIGILGGGALAWFAARPSETDRAAYLRRDASTGLPLRFGVSALPGGGLLSVGM